MTLNSTTEKDVTATLLSLLSAAVKARPAYRDSRSEDNLQLKYV